jgi:hypothetical protein
MLDTVRDCVVRENLAASQLIWPPLTVVRSRLSQDNHVVLSVGKFLKGGGELPIIANSKLAQPAVQFVSMYL